jgi:hypothetical protein
VLIVTVAVAVPGQYPVNEAVTVYVMVEGTPVAVTGLPVVEER